MLGAVAQATERVELTGTLPRGVTMTNRSDSACQGATFTIPLQVSGASAP